MESEASAAMVSWLPILFMVGIFYFLLYKPQKKAKKERDELLGSLKAGVEIITVGGLYGKITALDDEIVRLEIADKVEIKISRQAVNGIITKDKAAEE